MKLLLAILFMTLTRAELIERFRADPITKVSGMVRVVAACPADMRREFQGPVANFAANICNTLYTSLSRQPQRFQDPAIVIYIGSQTNVNSKFEVNIIDGETGKKTCFRLLSPAYTDTDKLRIELVKAFFRAVKSEEIDDTVAIERLHKAIPELRADDDYRALAKWKAGEIVDDDEKYLRKMRSVILPGTVRDEDVLTFASRLRLFPIFYDELFCGKYDNLEFRDAILLSKKDPQIRISALIKSRQVLIFGAGRSKRMNDAAQAYYDFLIELAKNKKSEAELMVMLGIADAKLARVLNSAE